MAISVCNIQRNAKYRSCGRASNRSSSFHFSPLFLSRNCAPIVTKPRRRKSPLAVDGQAVGKRGAEHFSPHSSIIHLRSSPRSSFFYSSLDSRLDDLCLFIRIPGASLVRRLDATRRGAGDFVPRSPRLVYARDTFEIRYVLLPY